MRVIVVTTYYPNVCDPVRAVFIRNISREMNKHASVDIVSPVPYVPFFARVGSYKCYPDIPSEIADDGITVNYPRFLVIPKLDFLNGLTYALGVMWLVSRLKRKYSSEKIILHVHCVYPDGFGVSLLSRMFKLPLVLTSHGSDINVLPDRQLIRPQIISALRSAHGVIGVSVKLVEKIQAIMGPGGTDTRYIPCAGFYPDRFNLKLAKQSSDDETVKYIYIGNLVKIKALDILIKAWNKVSGKSGFKGKLVIIGEGPEKQKLIDMVSHYNLGHTVQFLGRIDYASINQYIADSDFLCLPSYNEGTPNVVIEALACGVPVIGSRVGAIPDLVGNRFGILVEPGDVNSLAEAIKGAVSMTWDKLAISASVKDYAWDKLAFRNIEYLEQICNEFYSKKTS